MAPLPIPDLLPPCDDPNASLSQKFGRETVNYFSGGCANRLSWLRTDYDFLRKAFQHPKARFLTLKDLYPLVSGPTNLIFVSHEDVAPITGADPFGPSEGDLQKNFDSSLVRPHIVFLGLDQDEHVHEGGDDSSLFHWGQFSGIPVFAVDVTPREPYYSVAQNFIDAQCAIEGREFHAARMHVSLDASQAALFSQARAVIDWNLRNPFCAGCGQRTMSGHAGYKRVCPPTDRAGTSPGSEPTPRTHCPTRKGISNLSFPRTDPTMIAAIVSSDGSKLLLGRQKRYPPNLYSTLAGFIEPGESIEDSVRREVWEESGVRVGRVVIHSSQPWPYPANLMIGAVGQALPDGEDIFLGNDPELEHARWVPLEEVREALEFGAGALGEAAPEGYKEGNLRLPPQTAIANRLLSAVVEGFAAKGETKL